MRGFQGTVFTSRNLPLKLPTLYGTSPMANQYHPVLAVEPIALQMALGEERTWFATEVLRLPPTWGAFERWLGRTRALGAPPLFVHPPETFTVKASKGRDPAVVRALARLGTLPAAERISAQVTRYGRDDLELSVEAPADGWLLVTERWAPGWRATIDGRPVKAWAANFLWRAVQMKAGRHRVRFEYRPFGWPWLLLASWSSLGAVVLLSARGRLLRRSASAGGP